MKNLTLPICKRAIKRGNIVIIGATSSPDTGKSFGRYDDIKAYVKINGFHDDCWIEPQGKVGK